MINVHISIRAVTIQQIGYCMHDVHNILLYCNTDVAIISPVTGRASVRSTSVKTTRRVIASSFHTEKSLSTFTFQ